MNKHSSSPQTEMTDLYDYDDGNPATIIVRSRRAAPNHHRDWMNKETDTCYDDGNPGTIVA